MTGYTLDEIDAIAFWLQDGLSGKQLAAEFTAKFRFVTRNAVIGIVLRNRKLHAIGFARSSGSSKPKRVPQAPKPIIPPLKIDKDAALYSQNNIARKMAKQHLHPHNIVAKANSRQFDRPLPPPVPRVFECRGVALVELNDHVCKFPINDPKPGEGFVFCGNPSEFGLSPYCAGHHALAHGRGTDSERAAGPVLARAAA